MWSERYWAQERAARTARDAKVAEARRRTGEAELEEAAGLVEEARLSREAAGAALEAAALAEKARASSAYKAMGVFEGAVRVPGSWLTSATGEVVWVPPGQAHAVPAGRLSKLWPGWGRRWSRRR
ncbi:hypothetical protein [Kitasatospora cineracea]|uniref:Uncharacterized protein n=1 Tax=Kitasatospora cineracea TaxID=88074 RepID=A0A3N4R7M9_9ACTN|nr:hypothetical protein [Kitasatospora cineracea]RPE26621.1 hypothetical protein EDD38_7683 [Kitasatospora cineracea]